MAWHEIICKPAFECKDWTKPQTSELRETIFGWKCELSNFGISIKLFTVWHRLFWPQAAKHRTRGRSHYSPPSSSVLVVRMFVPKRKRFCSQSQCPDQFWGPHSIIVTGRKGLFRFGRNDWCVKLCHSTSPSAEVKSASSDIATSTHFFTT